MSENRCPECGAPARYLAIPHPEGEGTTIPLPIGALGGRWYHEAPYQPLLVRRTMEGQLEYWRSKIFEECGYTKPVPQHLVFAALTALATQAEVPVVRAAPLTP